MARYFITGGSGFIGSEVVKELIKQGHQVLALSRSSESADKLKAISPSIEIVHGTLEDLDVLSKAAKESDGVIHLGFNRDINDMDSSTKHDIEVIRNFGDALANTNKPFVFTGVIGGYSSIGKDQRITEDTPIESVDFGAERVANENFVRSLADRGVRAITIRLPPTVHGENDPQFIPMYVDLSKQNEFVAYLENAGDKVWSSVNKTDAAKLYVLAVEKGRAGSVYQAIGEEAVEVVDVAKAISKRTGLSVRELSMPELEAAYGFFSVLLTLSAPASSAKTQAELGWKPTGSTLTEDIESFY